MFNLCNFRTMIFFLKMSKNGPLTRHNPNTENLIQAAEQLIGDVGTAPTEAVRQVATTVERSASAVQAALASGELERIDSTSKALEASLKKLDAEVKAAKASLVVRGQAA